MGARPTPRPPTGEQIRLRPSQAQGGDLYDRDLLHPHFIRCRRLSKEDRITVEIPGQASFHHTTDLDHALLRERGKVIQQVRAAANEDSVVLALVQKEHLSSMLMKSANDEEHLYVLSSLRKLLRWSRDAANSRRMFDRDHVRRPDVFPHQLAGLSYHHFKIAVERIARFASYREILKRTWSQGFAPVLPAFHFRVDPVYSDESGELTGFDADVNLTLDWLCPGISAD
ncbi:MAG: hypothetical protein GY696_00925, partial [Gammaproteobacteria bacterium]|nr:hypothetical protein [Gammaproteobacteria bacterium]